MFAHGKIKAMGAIKKSPEQEPGDVSRCPQLRLLETAAAGVAAIAAQPS